VHEQVSCMLCDKRVEEFAESCLLLICTQILVAAQAGFVECRHLRNTKQKHSRVARLSMVAYPRAGQGDPLNSQET
jgi:hypothetical protein